MEIITNDFGKKLEVLEIYKGTKIVLGVEPVTHNICDHNGITLSGDFYYISTESYVKVHMGLKNISIQGGRYVHRTESNIAEGIEYVKKAIDKEIEYQIVRQRKRIAEHKASKLTTYVLNNVTINIVQYGDKTEIYVNEQPLRNAHLPVGFTLNDILKNIHTKIIAKYNVGKFSDLKTNFYKNRETHTVDMDVLPLYEFLGECVNINGRVCFPRDIRTNGLDNSISIVVENNEYIEVSLDDIKNIRFATDDSSPALLGIRKLAGMQNKLHYLE